MQDLRLNIEGMSCGGCVRNVTQALQAVPGATVQHVDVGSAQVSIDPAQASADDVKNAVEKRGFQVRQVNW